jgi:hypothetical protein
MKEIADQLTKSFGKLWSNGFTIYGDRVIATVAVWDNEKSQWVQRSAGGTTTIEAFQNVANLWLECEPIATVTVEVVKEKSPAKKLLSRG